MSDGPHGISHNALFLSMVLDRLDDIRATSPDLVKYEERVDGAKVRDRGRTRWALGSMRAVQGRVMAEPPNPRGEQECPSTPS